MFTNAMELSMKDSGWEALGTEMESLLTRMASFMKVLGLMEWLKEMESLSIRLEMFMRVDGTIQKLGARELTYQLIKANTLETGKTMSKKGTEAKNGQTEVPTSEHIGKE